MSLLRGRHNHLRKDPQELLERFRIVLNRLLEVGFKVKPSKYVLFKRDIEFLGHLVSVNGVDAVPDKLQAIRDWPTPHCLRDTRAFIGLASLCYRRFVRNFSTIAEPLLGLTKKYTSFIWSDEADLAFKRLKQALQDATTLTFPTPVAIKFVLTYVTVCYTLLIYKH